MMMVQAISTTATGIDVTGTVTADGLTVDGTAIVSDSTASVLRLLNTGTTGDGLIHFGDSASNFSGVIQYNHDADYMAFFTATQERMRIDSSGNVGIGTSSPAVKLHIEQNQAAYTYCDLVNLTNGGGAIFRQIVRNIADSGTTSVDLAKLIGSGFVMNNNDTNAANFTAFGVGASERMRIDSAGNVGIGVTDPQIHGKVAIRGGKAGTENSNLSLLTDGAAQGELANLSLYGTFEGTGDNGPRRTADIAAGFEGGNWGTEYLAFHVGNGGVANDSRLLTTERVRIDGSGNVGIGNSSPLAKLQIDNTAASHSLLNLHQLNTSYNTDLNLFNQASTTSNTIISKRTDGGLWLYQSGADYIAAYTNSSERLRIDSSGSLLVGTTSASSWKLAAVGSLPAHFTADSAAISPTYGGVVFYRPTKTSGNGNGFAFNLDNFDDTEVEYGYIGAIISGNTVGAQSGDLLFAPMSSGTRTERMRLDSSGNLLVGRSSAGAAATDNGHVFYGSGQHYIFSNATECVRFYETSGSGQQVGSISITSSATAFNTSSDERLKENIADAN
jgi:hypothetical protein